MSDCGLQEDVMTGVSIPRRLLGQLQIALSPSSLLSNQTFQNPHPLKLSLMLIRTQKPETPSAQEIYLLFPIPL
jgi:hypothetical protein